METKAKILLVDDKQSNLKTLRTILEDVDVEFIQALSGSEALQKIQQNDFALAILSVQMPEMDGFEAAALMRQNNKTDQIPILFVTAISKVQNHIITGYKSGAVDYICKPFDPTIILAKVSVFLELYRCRRDLEETQKELYEQTRLLERLAITDDLTGLYNRRHLNHILKQEFERCLRYETPLACLMIDLDIFKKVNDTYGHGFGDTVLCEFSRRIRYTLRASDIAFRFGGDEVLVLLPQTDIEGAKQTAEKIRLRCAAAPVSDADHKTTVTVSVGVASIPQHQAVLHNDLITFADKALYHAKENGRNMVEEYTRSKQKNILG